MTKKELETKVINAQSAVAKREAVLAKHREQLAKLIAKGADQYDIRYKQDDIKTATGKLEDARRILKNWQDKLGAQISRDAFIEARSSTTGSAGSTSSSTGRRSARRSARLVWKRCTPSPSWNAIARSTRTGSPATAILQTSGPVRPSRSS